MIEKIKEYQTIIFLAALYAAGWGSHVLYSNSVTQAIAETRALAAESAAQEIAKISITNTNIYNKVVERTKTEVQYRECHHDAETYSNIKDAFGGSK